MKNLSRKFWEIKDIAGYCQVCGEPIYNLVSIKFPNVNVKKWNCDHEFATRVTKV